MSERIAVIGLGYVGLPVAVALARKFPGTIGFDIAERRVAALRQGLDHTGELTPAELGEAALTLTTDPADLAGVGFFIVTVPTPIDEQRCPDLEPLRQACRTIARVLRPGAVVVFESTVYPGVTEEVCGPLLGHLSGLEPGVDFGLGYSPERINPGDATHRLASIVKVISASDATSLERLAEVYGAIVPAGLHRAPSIKVAEAAKVLENTQRDLNIALMNELALILDRLGLRTRDVLAAAQTKWNFLPFTPGLVGGHCIGVDPYYLTAKAEAVGYHPQVILAGRRINDGMAAFVVQRLVKLLIQADLPVRQARVGILGMTFKENVPDLRNSKVADILAELKPYGMAVRVHDPLASAADLEAAFGLAPSPLEAFTDLDALVLAVPHKAYLQLSAGRLFAMLRTGGALLDIKSVLRPEDAPADRIYWSL
ncbi:MAG TPA: nucleotide sugar dehydrogenase [Geminicoccaceae bacterium]|nr:nucleotide sugar dehydrogenase [Geminicoccaceae bacterium]